MTTKGDKLNRLKGFLVMMRSQYKALIASRRLKEAETVDGHITSVMAEVVTLEKELAEERVIYLSEVEINNTEPQHWRQRLGKEV